MSISGFLLEFTETCNFHLLLLLNTFQLSLFLLLPLGFRSVIFNNLLFEVLLFVFTLLLDFDGTLIGDLHFGDHLECAVLFSLEHFLFLDLKLFGLLDHLLHLALTDLLILNAFEFALLDLVNDDKRALLSGLLALYFTLLLQLE